MEWSAVGQTAARVLVVYVAVVVFVRISGNRTLAKMRAFDLIVTIALGTLFATAVVADTTPLWKALLVIALLVVVQWVVARLSVASRAFDRLVTNQSILLYREGDFDREGMRRARVTHDEIESAIREAGLDGPARVKEIRLETNGELSVVRDG